MEKSRKSKKSFIITLLLLVSLVCLPIISWAKIGIITDKTDDANIILAMESEEEVVDEADPASDEEVVDESDSSMDEADTPADDSDVIVDDSDAELEEVVE